MSDQVRGRQKSVRGGKLSDYLISEDRKVSGQVRGRQKSVRVAKCQDRQVLDKRVSE